MFHLAYLGLMFGALSESEAQLQTQVSLSHYTNCTECLCINQLAKTIEKCKIIMCILSYLYSSLLDSCVFPHMYIAFGS